MDIWKPFNIAQGECFHWQIGPLKLWLRRTENEWRLASEIGAEQEDSLAIAVSSPEPEGVQWKRWATGKESNVVQNVPVMPDHSLIVRPDTALTIARGNQALFYVTIPFWVRIAVGKDAQIALIEEPTVVLSHSWFGDPTTGELCYSLHTTARRTLDTLGPRPNRAICPIRVKNDATAPLDFQRLCVRVGHLSIYSYDTRLWTNDVTVKYKGEDKPTRVEYGQSSPAGLKAGELISRARTPLTHGFIQKGFDTLKSFAAMQGVGGAGNGRVGF
jgi:hypothetical protein